MRRFFVGVALLVLAFASIGCGGSEGTAIEPSTGPRADVAKFDSAWRSYRAVQSATDVGTDYQQFGPLLQAFATEVSLLGDEQLAAADQQVLVKLQEALAAYKDSYTLWQFGVEGKHGEKIDLSRQSRPTLDPIVLRYRLQAKSGLILYHDPSGPPVVDVGGESFQQGSYLTKESISIVMKAAEAKAEEAGGLLGKAGDDSGTTTTG